MPAPCTRALAALVLAAGLAVPAPRGEAAELSSADEQKLVERIKAEIMEELRDSDVIREAVRAGIADYVREQQEARLKAREQQERAAAAKAKNVRRVSADRDHIYGSPDATVSLIEYSDFECPYCKRFHDTARDLVDAYDGKVNWVYRHYPLAFHNPGAQKQAEASECVAELAGNDAFWAFTDAVYERTRSGGKGFPIERLAPLAVEIGVDEAAFRSCLDSGRHAGRVREDLEEGTAVGVTGTPGNILLNNATGEVRAMAGAQPLERFESAVDELLR